MMRRHSRPRQLAMMIMSVACALLPYGSTLSDEHATTPARLRDGRPNIVLILADDLGRYDLGCYGNQFFETPHLDCLAKQGVRMTQGYSPAPICSAARAGILTGKTPARLGLEFVTKNEPGYQPVKAPLRAPPFTLDLPLSEITIAEALSVAGYQTAFFGKWHLNRHYKRYLGWSPTHGPHAQGFNVAEEDFGSHPYSYWNDKSQRTFIDLPEHKFPPDSMTRRACRFLQSKHDKPFFLMVSHFYVHTPVHTRVRRAWERCLARIPQSHPRREQLAHYGAMVATLDHHVGELLDALDQSGQAGNTLVVFTSDNGGHPEYAGNAPLRGSKWNLYEGGIRVPLLIRWPGRTEAGSVSDVAVSGIDLFPTFVSIAGASLPDKIDGQSFEFLFQQSSPHGAARPMIWHFPYYHPERGFDKAPQRIGINDGVTSQTRPHSVLRSGPWKLLHFYESGRDELYHLPSDLAEQNDRSRSDPDVAARLRQQLNAALKTCRARLPTAVSE